jgi:hypothetical protein
MAISLTSQGSSLVIDQNGVKKVLPKGDITVKLNLPYLELSYNGTPEFQIQDHTLVTTPESESIADLFDQLPGLLDTTSEGGGGGDVTDTAIISALGYTPANASNIANRTNWDAAYGWGNHASAGYAPANAPTLTGNVVLPSTTTIGTVSATELSYLDGVTTSIQPNIEARQTIANLSTDLTASASKYPSVNAVNTGLALKANLASPALTGTPTAPTASGGTNTTQIATTAFVTAGLATKQNSFAGTTGQYVRGDGSLATFPTIPSNSDYVDLTSAQSSIAGAKGFTATMTTVGIQPTSNGASDIGTSSLKYQTVFANRVNAVGTLSLMSSNSNAILFAQTSPTAGVMGGFAASTGHFILQAPGSSLTTSTGELFQVNGTAKITGATSIGGDVTLSSIPTLGTAATSFLTSNSGVVSSRTPAQVLSDIGGYSSTEALKRTAFFEPQGNGVTVNTVGLPMTAQGSAAASNVATTNFYTRQRRIRYTGATTANENAGVIGNAQYTVANGFTFRGVFGIHVYNAGHRYTIGVGNTSTNTVEPSTLLNRISMYADAGDTNFKIRGADGSSGGTVVDLGANFPVNSSATDMYDVTFSIAPGGTSATYFVKRINTGDTASGTISTVPGNALLSAQIFASNAATGAAADIVVLRASMTTDN